MNKTNGPPEHIDPSDLWAQITTLPRAHRAVPFPRCDKDGLPIGRIAITVLQADEVTLSNFHAEKFAREHSKKIIGEIPKSTERNESYSECFRSRASREILFRSCKKAHECEPDERGVCLVDHDKLTAFFPTVESIGKQLSNDEIAVLMNLYMQTQHEVGPIVSNLSQSEFDSYVEVLAKGGSTDPLAFLSWGQQSDLVMYMACQLYALRAASCSPITQPESDTSPA